MRVHGLRIRSARSVMLHFAGDGTHRSEGHCTPGKVSSTAYSSAPFRHGDPEKKTGITSERLISNHPEPDPPQYPLMHKPRVGSVPVPSDWYDIRLFSDVFPTHGGRAHREEAGKIQHVKWMPHQRACSLPETSSERHGRNREGWAAYTNRQRDSIPWTLIRTTLCRDSLNLQYKRHAVVLTCTRCAAEPVPWSSAKSD